MKKPKKTHYYYDSKGWTEKVLIDTIVNFPNEANLYLVNSRNLEFELALRNKKRKF